MVISLMATALEVAALPWVQALDPLRSPLLGPLSSHSALAVWHVDVQFKEWRIPPEHSARWATPKVDASETWRKRPLVLGTASGLPYSCGEVELTARLRRAGFNAFWISEWSGFPHVPEWAPYCVKRSELKTRAEAVWAADAALRKFAISLGTELGTGGGHPDVVAWKDNIVDAAYLEYKGPGDSIKPKQNSWAAAQLAKTFPRISYAAVRGAIVPASIAEVT